MNAIAGIGHNGGPKFWLPKFEPWRLLRPLKMFDGQFFPYQPLQFMDGLLAPIIGISVAGGGVIDFVGGENAGKVGATSGTSIIALDTGLTGGLASGVSAGDLVMAVFGTGSTADRTLSITDGTTEYTEFGTEQYSNDVFDTNLRVAYKFMGGTPDTATTFGPTGNAADAGAMAVYVFRGVHATVNDVAVTVATGINTSRADPPAITPVTAGAFIVCIGAAAHNGGADTFTSSDLTDFLTRPGGDDTNDVTIGIGYKPDWVSGPFDAAAFGHSQADSVDFSWCAKTIALRPA